MPDLATQPETSHLDGQLRHWCTLLPNAQPLEAELIWVRIDALLDARIRLLNGEPQS